MNPLKILRSISLQYKFMVPLIVLPTLSGAIYLYFVNGLFERDKISYVYDSGLSVAKSISSQISSEIKSIQGVVGPIVDAHDSLHGIPQEVENYFYNNPDLQSLILFDILAEDRFKISGQLVQRENGTSFPLEKYLVREKISYGLRMAKKSGQHMEVASMEEGLLWLYYYKEKADNSKIMVASLVRVPEMVNVFKASSLYSNYLLSSDGKVIVSPAAIYGELKKTPLSNWKSIKSSDFFSFKEGAKEVLSPEGSPWLLSYSKLSGNPFTMVSLVEKKKALEAIVVLEKKSAIFLLALISFAVIVSFIVARKITSALRELSRATEEVSGGKYDVKIRVEADDEIGVLSKSFNKMIAELNYLMTQTAEKARMEGELKTAQVVQETLFPKMQGQLGPLAVSGYYRPASECGGDWWYYFDQQDKVFLMIGDATGHGASAALITSAAKSAISIAASLPDVGPQRIMELANRGICETAQGKLCMTFFVAMFDKKNGQLTYSCAGHEPALFLKSKSEGELSKDEVVPLNSINGNRLGQDPLSTFSEGTLQLSPGDAIIFYTDGVCDMENPDGKKWKERRFIKSITQAMNKGLDLGKVVQSVVVDIENFRDGAPLADDITFFMCRYLDELASSEENEEAGFKEAA